MEPEAQSVESCPEATGRIGACPVCELALPLRLPKRGEADTDWICNGCGAHYFAVLDRSAPGDILKNIRPAILHINREALKEPPEAITRFVAETIKSNEGYSDRRKSVRHPMVAPVAVVPVNENYHPIGEPFMAMARDLSAEGMALVHTRAVEAKFLVVELENASSQRFQLALKVLRCRALGRFYEVAGMFVERLG